MPYLTDINQTTKGLALLPLILKTKSKRLSVLQVDYKASTESVHVSCSITGAWADVVSSGTLSYGFYDRLMFTNHDQASIAGKDILFQLDSPGLLESIKQSPVFQPTAPSVSEELFRLFEVMLKQKNTLIAEAKERRFDMIYLDFSYPHPKADGSVDRDWPQLAIKAVRGMQSVRHAMELPETGNINLEPHLHHFSSVYR